MRRTLAVCIFVAATLTWSLAQNPSATPPSGQQPPSGQTPDASQSQTAPSGAAGQDQSQPSAQPPSANATITEGCLGGSGTNYTLTDKAGTSYKLNFPSSANVATLSSHVGESVRVMGDINKDSAKAGQSSIDVAKIGRGTGTCPSGAGSSAPAQTPQPPKP